MSRESLKSTRPWCTLVTHDKQLQRTVERRCGAQQARHLVMRLLRAGQCSARLLNCGVRRQKDNTEDEIWNQTWMTRGYD